jgi:hypothetical protein
VVLTESHQQPRYPREDYHSEPEVFYVVWRDVWWQDVAHTVWAGIIATEREPNLLLSIAATYSQRYGICGAQYRGFPDMLGNF